MTKDWLVNPRHFYTNIRTMCSCKLIRINNLKIFDSEYTALLNNLSNFCANMFAQIDWIKYLKIFELFFSVWGKLDKICADSVILTMLPLKSQANNDCVCGKKTRGWCKLKKYLLSCWNNLNQSYLY